MKAVIPEVLPDVLAWRKRIGMDRWDEMWEGVLHMPPAPNREHQDLQLELAVWLRTHWARAGGNRIHCGVNLALPGGWPHDYRIPDLVLLTPQRFGIDRNDYLEGAPEVVVEIRSPGDESIEKLAFFAKLGVPEVWLLDRDTKTPEIYALRDGDYHKQPPSDDGWIRSAATGIQLRAEPGRKLSLQVVGNEDTRRRLPED